jgi:outer membrane murein-binding lipoprotein Lpp
MDADANQRIDELEDRIADLEATVQALQSDDGGTGTDRQAFDHYDEYVLEVVDDVAEADGRTLMAAYDDAGIVNRSKKKQRSKRLRRLAGGE